MERPDATESAPPCGRLHASRNGFLYAGTVSDTVTQRNSAIVCVAMTERTFSVRTRTQSMPAASAVLVRPGYRRLDTASCPIVLLDVCPTDYHFRALARVAIDIEPWPRAHFADLIDALEDYRGGRMSREDADTLHARVLERALQQVPPVPPLDPRIRHVMRLLREEPGRPVAELAAAVDLSVDWLRRLFTSEAGVPMHRYEMTLRLQIAAAHLHQGVSLTQVAANAGFADLAHFSKVWKLHYGFAPRRAFSGAELVIDEIPWACMQATHPSAETREVPAHREVVTSEPAPPVLRSGT